ncbi:SagB/ThcOx family dehydrogenase [Streptomyces roseoviridis]|uniref:SagB/ThcOx family dehydrogenase n=1 Tax=Streptomyces roseoviridis TaxID=67361 RepID=A0ABV5QT53_9ACTN
MEHLAEDHPVDLPAALALARSARHPGPDTPAGRAVPAWPGPPRPFPPAGPADLDPGALLRLSLAASDASGRLRPTPSAGALHPVDATLVVGAGCSLPPGRYGYDPLRHHVHRLGPRPAGTPPGLTAELSVTPRRTTSHYGHRAWPLLLLDTGHAAAALFLAARALGAAEPEIDLDGHTRHPLARVHVPPWDGGGRRGGPPQGADGRGADGRGGGLSGTSGRRGGGAVSARAAGGGAAAAGASLPGFTPTPEELLARRSDPPPLHGAPAPEAVHAVLAAAVRAGGDELRWCVAVGGAEPGLLEAAGGGAPRRCAAGEARPALAAWAAGQGWIAGAGAVLLARGCPSDADAPHIRRAHLRAGFAVHLAHVTARRHGLAARPVGSWQQADLGAALGAAPGRDWVVHGLALGTGTLHADEENTT